MKKPDKCHKCDRKAEVKTIDKWLCRRCFVRQLEEKLRHNLRRYNIRKDAKIYAPDPACRYVLSRVINRPVEIIKDRKRAEWTAEPRTLDHENSAFLDRLFNGKKLAARTNEDEKRIKLFLPATIEDMKYYFKAKNIKYAAKKTPLMKKIDKMEAKYAGLKASLLRSQTKIEELGQR